MTSSPIPIGVVGGGIAGWSCVKAIQSLNLNFQLHLFEKQAQNLESGYGLQLSPNATKVLYQWGLKEALMDYCHVPQNLIVQLLPSNKIVAQFPLHTHHRKYGFPYICICRQDLLNILQNNCQTSNLYQHFGTEVQGQTEQNNSYQLHLANKQNFYSSQDLSASIYCDGIHSKMRANLQPTIAINPSSFMACRTTLALERHLSYRNDVVLFLGEGFHLLLYAMGKNRNMNCVLIAPKSWQCVKVDQWLLMLKQKLSAPLAELLNESLQWEFFPLYEGKPLSLPEQLYHQLVCLVGDAGHIMLPFLGQGAAMAIEDAYVLAHCLQNNPNSIDQALKKYAQLRTNRVARVQQKALLNGKLFHSTGLIKAGLSMSLQIASKWLLDLPWLYRFGLD